MTKKIWLVATLFLAFGFLVPGRVAWGQKLQNWVGKKVVIKYRTPLRVGRQVVDDGGEFRIYEVERVRGDWLWLVAGGVSGWVQSAHVVIFDWAIAFYTQEIRANPNNGSAYIGRGQNRVQRGEYDKAIADYDQAIRLNPNDGLAFVCRGMAWIMKGKLGEAIADFDTAIRLRPNDPSVFSSRGSAWAAKKDFDRAISDYSKTIRLNPKDAGAFGGRGIAWAARHEFDRAIADLDEAIRLDPKDARSYCNRGSAWNEKGEFDKALADYDEAIRLDPKAARAFTGRGTIWDAKGESDRAIAEYDKAIGLEPNYALSFNLRGTAWAAKHEFARATADLDEAIRLDPEDYSAYSNRAWILATCPDERYRDGKRAFESATRACELSKGLDAKSLSTLAAAHAEMGNFEKAIEWQERANKLFTDPSMRKRGEQLLALYKQKKPYRWTERKGRGSRQRKHDLRPRTVA